MRLRPFPRVGHEVKIGFGDQVFRQARPDIERIALFAVNFAAQRETDHMTLQGCWRFPHRHLQCNSRSGIFAQSTNGPSLTSRVLIARQGVDVDWLPHLYSKDAHLKPGGAFAMAAMMARIIATMATPHEVEPVMLLAPGCQR